MRKGGGRAAVAGIVLALAACGGGNSSASKSSDAPAGGMNVASGCSPASAAGGPYCLHFAGTQYGIHVGERFKVALVRADGSNTVVASAKLDAIPAADFTVDLPQAMAAGTAYYVDYYVDHNGNALCDAPPVDHVWRSHVAIDFYTGTITSVTATEGDVTWNAPHDDPWVTDPVGMNTCPQLNQVP